MLRCFVLLFFFIFFLFSFSPPGCLSSKIRGVGGFCVGVLIWGWVLLNPGMSFPEPIMTSFPGILFRQLLIHHSSPQSSAYSYLAAGKCPDETVTSRGVGCPRNFQTVSSSIATHGVRDVAQPNVTTSRLQETPAGPSYCLMILQPLQRHFLPQIPSGRDRMQRRPFCQGFHDGLGVPKY